MEQFKKAKIFLLETKRPPQIGDICYTNSFKWFICSKKHIERKIIESLVAVNGIKVYKMYITEYKEIKDKDYFIVEDTLYTHLFIKTKEEIPTISNKVIAILGNHIYPPCDGHCSDDCVCTYPQPSKQFIEKYIESYNKGEVITDILVEYETTGGRWSSNNTIIYYKQLKINPKDNTITIKKVKNAYTKEEVVFLCNDAYEVGYSTAIQEETNKGKAISFEEWLSISDLDIELNKIYTKDEVIRLLGKYNSFIWSEVGIQYPISLGVSAKDKFINLNL